MLMSLFLQETSHLYNSYGKNLTLCSYYTVLRHGRSQLSIFNFQFSIPKGSVFLTLLAVVGVGTVLAHVVLLDEERVHG